MKIDVQKWKNRCRKLVGSKVLMKHSKDYQLIKNSKFFDKSWYRKTYKLAWNVDPVLHYLTVGYQSKYSPSNQFSPIKYELIYDDVRLVGANPLLHYEKYGHFEDKFTETIPITKEEKRKISQSIKEQDKNIRREYDPDLKKLIVFLIPEVDTIGGGVMSICSIAKETASLKKIHGCEVILATMPSEKTFSRYTKFDAGFSIYRFDQLTTYFNHLEEVILHFPEIYVYPFLYFLTPNQFNWLKKIPNVTSNILNQNATFLPRPQYVEYLRKFSNQLTMTCAHKEYCVPQLRTSYNMPIHWLSASNMVKYKYVPYEKKENLLLYSPDDHPMKEKILQKIKDSFPDMKMQMIHDLSYKEYLNLIGRAKWMITFGEGLDGYFMESSRSGTLAFAVYNQVFFNEKFDGLSNVYNSYNDMLEQITSDMVKYDNAKTYKKITQKIIDLDKKEYNDDEYLENIKKYYLKDYTYPMEPILKSREERIRKEPLISIAVATYNGERFLKEQIDSLLNLDYKNIEIVVSDDGSSDKTLSILNAYGDKIKLFQNQGKHGLNSNFENAIRHSKGEYIALCDQDDVWHSDKLNILLERIDDFDLIHSGVTIIDEKGEYHSNQSFHKFYEIDKTSSYKLENFIKENLVLGCTTLMKREFVMNCFPIPDDIIYHDWWFTLCAIAKGKGIAFVDCPTINYRKHDSNTSFKTYNSLEWSIKKQKFDKEVLNYFTELTKLEKNMLRNDINYNIIREVFYKYLPNDVDLFFNQNYNYFSNEFVEELRLAMEVKNER